MQNHKTITIGIPTYNRCDALLERLRELFSNPLPENVTILIIDNDSSDKTYEKALQFSKGKKGIRVIRNPQNLGYAGNFFRLIEEADSDYIFINSDEDEVLIKEIPDYLRFLEVNSPDFSSPKATVFDYTYRAAGKRGPIDPRDFKNASNYLSGITFSLPAAREACKKVAQKIDTNAAAHVYPQVLVVAEILATGNGLWYPKTLTSKRQQLHSYINNPDGSVYHYLTGRYQQNIGFIDYLSEMQTRKQNRVIDDGAIKKMLLTAEQRVFYDLRAGLGSERPDLLKAFDLAGKEFYGPFGFARRLAKKVLLVCKEPGLIVPYLKKRLNVGRL